MNRPTCDCGKPGQWWGDPQGLRVFMCNDCRLRQWARRMAEEKCGFVQAGDMPELLEIRPGFPLLVRCGAKRFEVPAVELKGAMARVEAGGDYVRDVSISARTFERLGVRV